MTGVVRLAGVVFADPARVSVCESCGSVCDMSSRAEGARDRAFAGHLSVGLPR